MTIKKFLLIILFLTIAIPFLGFYGLHMACSKAKDVLTNSSSSVSYTHLKLDASISITPTRFASIEPLFTLIEIIETPTRIKNAPEISNFVKTSLSIKYPSKTTKIRYDNETKEEILGDKYFNEAKNNIEEKTSKKV